MFKAGDRVRCIRVDNCVGLTIGEIYTVLKTENSLCYVNIENDRENVDFYLSNRFQKVEDKMYHAHEYNNCIKLFKNGQTWGLNSPDILERLKAYNAFPCTIHCFNEDGLETHVKVINEPQLTFKDLKVGDKFDFTHTSTGQKNCVKANKAYGSGGWFNIDDSEFCENSNNCVDNYTVKKL